MSLIGEVVAGRRRTDAGWLVVAVAIGVLVVLAVHDITAKSFWYDEAMSLTLARLAPDRLLAALAGREANGSLYFAVLSVWRMLGEGEARIRFLSVVFAGATIPLLYVVGRRHVGAAAAILGCALFAVNPFLIEFAQEARGYTMAIFLTTAAVLAWSFATKDDRARSWSAYAVLSVAALYTHIFCGFVALGLGITWLLGAAPRTRSGLVAQGAIVVAALPLAGFVALSGFDQIDWILPISQAGVSAVLGGVAAGSLVLALLLYGAALVSIPSREAARWRRLAPLIAWWLTPLVAGIAISTFRSLLEPRYFIVALPAMLLLASAGFVRLGTTIGRERGAALAGVVALVLVVALSAGPLLEWYEAPRFDWRGAAGWVARDTRPGDRIAYIPVHARTPMGIYLDRYTDGPPVETTIDELRENPHRAWLVLYLIRGVRYDGLEATLPGYRVVESKFFDGVRVQLIERSG